MIDKKYIDMILDRVDCAKVVGDYVTLKMKGHRAWACCPFHKEDTPSFCVDTAKNLWFCHGSCHEGGNVITFIMKKENLPFNLAVKKLLKDQLNINISDSDMQSTPEEEELHKKKESMRVINDRLSTFFFEELYRDTPEAKAAQGYLKQRGWSEEYCKDMRIGYAPNDSKRVLEFVEKQGLSVEIMQEMGILKLSEKTNALYCTYWNRIMIPIRDRYHNIEGFTARTMDETKDSRKYMNSSESEIYKKSLSIFGIDYAMQEARRQEKLFLVEGGPDVMKLQSVGINNTIASLGGAWTKGQFQMLRDYRLHGCTLCFIPDSDVPKGGAKLGAGFENVIKNGALAMQCGFTVSVREIPNDLEAEHPHKVDPDEFFTKATDMASLTEKEFLLWYMEKKFDPDSTTEEKQKLIADIADLLIHIKNEEVLEVYITKLAVIDGTKGLWRQALNSAKRRQQERLSDANKKDGIDMLRQFGFMEKHNCYYGYDKDAKEVQWSNFTLKPLFHIKDDLRPVRLFEIDNDEYDKKAEVIEMDMDTFTSSKSMRKKLLGTGNYIWMASDEQLISLQRYLAKVTETAVEIKQLGWQKDGFYAFSNGALEKGEWHEIDKMGIVRLEAGIYYLPALSELYRDSKELYVNERKFRLTNYSKVSLNEYFGRIASVFGDNAKVALAFYVTSLFADIIRSHGIKIPILNLFGQPGSGKTELASSLMSFFQQDYEAPNIESTIASLADHIASVSNALVHIDEYKNSIDEKKSQLLKDLWNGVGRMRMNMDKDKKREQSRVDSALVLTGQEMPTVDFALFTRLIYLSCDKHTFTEDDHKRFDELMKLRMMGATHITVEILKHRERFEASIGTAWKKAETDLKYNLRNDQLAVDRLRTNWSVVLAAYLATSECIDWPFSYDDLLAICTEGCRKQNALCATVDEVAGFWSSVSAAVQMGLLVDDQDYKVKYLKELKVTKAEDPIEFFKPKPILMIRKDIFLTRYRQMAQQQGEKVLPKESMEKYLENTHEFIGIGAMPERFKKYGANGVPEQIIETDETGNIVSRKTKWQQNRPMCFDYEVVSAKYNIMIGGFTAEQPAPAEEKKKESQGDLFRNNDTDDSDVPIY